MRQETYYQVLQVDPEATPAVIEAAFRRLARQYHPDICTEKNDPEKMKEITAAYSVLRHQITRVTYDKELAHITQDDESGESQTLARIGIVGSIIILCAVLVLSMFQGRSPAVALDGSRAAEMRAVAATDTANAILIRNAIVLTLTAMPTEPQPLAVHATPWPGNIPDSLSPAVVAIAKASEEGESQSLEQSAGYVSIGSTQIEPPANKAQLGESNSQNAPAANNSVGVALSKLAAASLEQVVLEAGEPQTSAIEPVQKQGASDTVPAEKSTTVPTLVPTVIPTVAPTARPTATSFAAAVAPVRPDPTVKRVSLVEPSNNVESGGIEIFAWNREFELEANQAIELVFWQAGEEPIQHGFGLAAPTTTDAIAVNLDALDEALGPLLDPGRYRWGLLLVEVNPYRRVDYVGGGNDFRFANFGTNGSSGRARQARSGE